MQFFSELAVLVFLTCHGIGMTSTISNPALYAFLNENFRKEFRRMFGIDSSQPGHLGRRSNDRQVGRRVPDIPKVKINDNSTIQIGDFQMNDMSPSLSTRIMSSTTGSSQCAEFLQVRYPDFSIKATYTVDWNNEATHISTSQPESPSSPIRQRGNQPSPPSSNLLEIPSLRSPITNILPSTRDPKDNLTHFMFPDVGQEHPSRLNPTSSAVFENPLFSGVSRVSLDAAGRNNNKNQTGHSAQTGFLKFVENKYQITEF
ncbi:uncharacterized protein LOC111695735 isoform X1 [Eurytemora carolleeae]|uniref:uncharacterized protein LOC111695735 isoform X1 n=1 Tax=Eurytemora carolleeae TaxID=1294199 RepID=UPI000C75B239|nr:uncharacterized protein LOC111695735 isoform X1 [Eurytemora carolleeae]|eukprot:XP_023320931.1 uncharacterized protein LOC111695735 isoform X1 [Eurytemora affinis]